MSNAVINYPTPMTAEARKMVQGVCLDSRLFCYGPNDWGTAPWYKEKYPGFRDEEYTIMELYSNGMTTKQHRNMLKKQKKAARLTTASVETYGLQPNFKRSIQKEG